MYTLSPSLIEIYRKVTKLCCFNQDNPRFSMFERHAELTERERVHWEDWVTLKVSRFERAGLSRVGLAGQVPAENLRRLMNWKSPWKSCHKNTSTRRWWTSPSAWLPMWLWLPIMVVAPSICTAVTLFVSKSASSSHHQQIGSFQSHQHTTGGDNAWNAEKWALSWLK